MTAEERQALKDFVKENDCDAVLLETGEIVKYTGQYLKARVILKTTGKFIDFDEISNGTK